MYAGQCEILIELRRFYTEDHPKVQSFRQFFNRALEQHLLMHIRQTRSTVRLQSGMQVDLRVVPQVGYGAALLYFTGSKAHNIAIRTLAIKKGYKINEYSVFRR